MDFARSAVASEAGQPEVPIRLEQALDREWLSAALAPVSGGSPVISVELTELIKTMASKARIAVRFENDPEQVHAYCLKAFLDNEGDPSLGGSTTIREADFYTEIAPQLTMRLPSCASAVVDREAQRGILILEDLIIAGARFCSALEPFDSTLAAQSLDQIARLHAKQSLLSQLNWLPTRIEQVAASPHLSATTLQDMLAGARGEGLPERARDAALLLKGMKKLAERNGTQPQTLLHGDCHAGNLYLTADGPGFTDWQLIQRGNWSLDVAYHIAAVLPVEVAERHERDLLDGYLEAVRRHGGTPPDQETAWQDYRAAHVYGYYQWAITRLAEPKIIHVFMARLGAAVTRHESYRLLGL